MIVSNTDGFRILLKDLIKLNLYCTLEGQRQAFGSSRNSNEYQMNTFTNVYLMRMRSLFLFHVFFTTYYRLLGEVFPKFIKFEKI